eukprot:4490782-Prymnesium_polylepis.1
MEDLACMRECESKDMAGSAALHDLGLALDGVIRAADDGDASGGHQRELLLACSRCLCTSLNATGRACAGD